jgi:hypothetical protein
MGKVSINTRVSKDPRFVRVGPEASWLWVCGRMYSQDSGLAGFIPVEVLPFLGVPKPAPLVERLVAEGLWVVVEGGWTAPEYRPPVPGRGPVRRFLAALVAFWGRRCVYCGLRADRLEVEHIVPVTRGGTDDLTNLTLACPTCNRRKGRQTAAEFGHPHVHDTARGIQ